MLHIVFMLVLLLFIELVPQVHHVRVYIFFSRNAKPSVLCCVLRRRPQAGRRSSQSPLPPLPAEDGSCFYDFETYQTVQQERFCT